MPRFLGGVIAMPLLAAIFSIIGIYGAQLIGVQLMGVDSGSFWSQMRDGGRSASTSTEGIVKSVIFGVACSLIAVYEGYYAVPTAEGVGRATTRTVVTSAVAGVVPGLPADVGLFVRGTFSCEEQHIESWDRGIRAPRIRGIVLPDHPDHQPRARLRQPAALRPDARSSTTSATCKVGSPVSMSGVEIGRVVKHRLRHQRIQGGGDACGSNAQYNQIPTDSDASIYTQGLLGGKFIGLTAGGAETYLKNGDQIDFTQSAFVLENLIGQLLANFAKSGSGSASSKADAPAATAPPAEKTK